MREHPIQGVMETTMDYLKDMIEVNTIIGDPVETSDGTVILPISKVGFGFATGGSDYYTNNENSNESPFGGGSGGGVSITPVAFLIVSKQETKMIHLDEGTHLYEKLLDIAPQTVNHLKDILDTYRSSNTKNQKSEQQMNYDI